MSKRDFAKTQIDLLTEESLEKVITLISIEIGEKEEPIEFTDELMTRIDAALREGMADIEAGRVISSEEMEKEMRGWFRKHDI
jgi:hypothetical protein